MHTFIYKYVIIESSSHLSFRCGNCSLAYFIALPCIKYGFELFFIIFSSFCGNSLSSSFIAICFYAFINSTLKRNDGNMTVF